MFLSPRGGGRGTYSSLPSISRRDEYPLIFDGDFDAKTKHPSISSIVRVIIFLVRFTTILSYEFYTTYLNHQSVILILAKTCPFDPWGRWGMLIPNRTFRWAEDTIVAVLVVSFWGAGSIDE